LNGTAAVAVPGKELLMRHPLVRAVALVLLLTVAAPPLALAAGESLPRPQAALPSAFGQIWNLIRSVFVSSGHEIDPDGAQSSNSDSRQGIDPDGLQSSDPDRGHGIDPNG
jgi:hypothetical protein